MDTINIKGNFPKVKINEVDLIENEYHDQHGNVWNALKLIEQSKKYDEFDLPIAGIDISRMPWGINTINDFVHHIYRLNKTNLSYPIILDDEGIIADGWHRIAKAILEGKTTIKAIRLEEMPQKDRQDEKD